MPEITDYATQEKSSYELFRDLLAELGVPFGPSVYGFDSVYEAVHHRIAEELSDEIREQADEIGKPYCWKTDPQAPRRARIYREVADGMDPRVQLAQALTQGKTL